MAEPKETTVQRAKEAFVHLITLAQHDHAKLALLECKEKATGKIVAVISVVSEDEGGEFDMIPVARMYETPAQAYNELYPPDPDNAGKFLGEEEKSNG